MDTDAPRFRRTAPIERALNGRLITVDRDIFVVTPEEFEPKKDDEYPFVCEIVSTGKVVYEAESGKHAMRPLRRS
jgi:hypothetical protein